jgi:hypothetical protein
MLAETRVGAEFLLAPLPAYLRRAYENAEYAIFGERELVLRIGVPSRALDAMMAAHRAASAAYLSAANPEGELRSEEHNRAAHEELLRSRWLAGKACYEGESRHPLGRRPPKPSVLVLGLSRRDAVAIGRDHAQRAIVFVEKGRAPELVDLAYDL